MSIDLDVIPAIRDDSPVVYAIRMGFTGPIKLGYTNDLRRRLVELQVGSPVELRVLLAMPGCLDDETALHVRFKPDLLRGEWYRPSETLLAWIEAERAMREL